MIHDVARMRARWQEHVSKRLRGSPTTFQALQAGMEQDRIDRFADLAPDVDVELMPLPVEVAATLSTKKRGKACGEDGIPPEVHVSVSGPMAAAITPVYQRACLLGAEPLAWRGGAIHELYKGKGDPCSTNSYRDITLEDIVAKDYHMILRRLAAPSITTSLGRRSAAGWPAEAPISASTWAERAGRWRTFKRSQPVSSLWTSARPLRP